MSLHSQDPSWSCPKVVMDHGLSPPSHPQNTVDKIIKKTNLALVIGTHSWREQFLEAITVSAGKWGGRREEEERDEETETDRKREIKRRREEGQGEKIREKTGETQGNAKKKTKIKTDKGKDRE